MDKFVLSAEDKSIVQIARKQGISPMELNELLKVKSVKTGKLYNHIILGKVKIGIISDTQIGSDKFDEELFKRAAGTFYKEKVKAVYHPGDILEGMSGREGNVYELSQIGFSQQMGYAEKLWKRYLKGLQTYGIIGNHDEWYKKKNNGGVNVGEELEKRLGKENFTYLGEDEADIKLGPRTIMRLFHPNDGTAYAISYKMQKLIESLESGRKPNILVEGHYHKALYMFHRNVHGIEAGTLCGQTGWMRGKKIPAHKGFWILDMDISDSGISRFQPTFYPAYE